MPIVRSGSQEAAHRVASGAKRICCGEGGIRTLGTVTRTHDFQSCTFGHSVTSPGDLISARHVYTEAHPACLPLPRAGRRPSTALGKTAARSAASWGNPSGESGIRDRLRSEPLRKPAEVLDSVREPIRQRRPRRGRAHPRARNRMPKRTASESRRGSAGPSGESGIRTHGTLAGTPDFESGTFGHSVISPRRNVAGTTGTVNASAGGLGRVCDVGPPA
jgi:hypothetical protein